MSYDSGLPLAAGFRKMVRAFAAAAATGAAGTGPPPGGAGGQGQGHGQDKQNLTHGLLLSGQDWGDCRSRGPLTPTAFYRRALRE